jgi:hypothetical protein
MTQRTEQKIGSPPVLDYETRVYGEPEPEQSVSESELHLEFVIGTRRTDQETDGNCKVEVNQTLQRPAVGPPGTCSMAVQLPVQQHLAAKYFRQPL